MPRESSGHAARSPTSTGPPGPPPTISARSPGREPGTHSSAGAPGPVSTGTDAEIAASGGGRLDRAPHRDHVDGLGQVEVEAGVEGAAAVLGLPVAGHRDEGDVRPELGADP